MEPDLTAANKLDEQTRAEDAGQTVQETPAAGDVGEGSPSESGAGEETGTKTETDTETSTGTETGTKAGDGEETVGEDASAIKDLLEETGLDMDGLKAAIESDKDLKALFGDKDPAEILRKAGELDKIEAQRLVDDENNLRESEEPEETVARLDQQLAELKQGINDSADKRRGAEEARKEIDGYDSTVSSLVNATDLPEAHKKLLISVLDSSNPVASIDFANKGDIKKMVDGMVGKLSDFSDGVISDYTDGKDVIPKVTTSSPAAIDAKGEKPTNITEATQWVLDKLKKRTG